MDYNRMFSYELPTKIEFGVGVSERVAERVEECGGSRVLFVVDPGVLDAGVADKIVDSLKKASMPTFSSATSSPSPRRGASSTGWSLPAPKVATRSWASGVEAPSTAPRR